MLYISKKGTHRKIFGPINKDWGDFYENENNIDINTYIHTQRKDNFTD